MENNVWVTNFLQKSTIFNDYFAKQCTIHDNGSALPPMKFRTSSELSNISIYSDKVVGRIMKQKLHKAHGCDNISMAMLKLCPVEIDFPVSLIFQHCIDTGKYPDSWKLANVQPIHKKMIGKSKLTTVLPHFYFFVEKFLKKSFLTKSMPFYNKIDLFQQCNLDLDMETPVYTNSFP